MTNKKSVLVNLRHLLKDFQMLEDGTWEPDTESIRCSIENIEETIELVSKGTTTEHFEITEVNSSSRHPTIYDQIRVVESKRNDAFYGHDGNVLYNDKECYFEPKKVEELETAIDILAAKLTELEGIDEDYTEECHKCHKQTSIDKDLCEHCLTNQ